MKVFPRLPGCCSKLCFTVLPALVFFGAPLFPPSLCCGRDAPTASTSGHAGSFGDACFAGRCSAGGADPLLAFGEVSCGLIASCTLRSGRLLRREGGRAPRSKLSFESPACAREAGEGIGMPGASSSVVKRSSKKRETPSFRFPGVFQAGGGIFLTLKGAAAVGTVMIANSSLTEGNQLRLP